MDVANRAPRVSQILLADQHERSLGHAPGVDVAFVGRQFGQRADYVHGAGPTGVGIGRRHAAFGGEVDLECPRPCRKRR